ncbi:MAG: OmpA family protein [Candidatus Omnitrophica bacterium]|nr:OmpA family protein [Candidatus Omnitrophota bacterium]
MKLFFVILVAVVLAGCNGSQDIARLTAHQAATIRSLNQEVTRLNQEMDELIHSREDLAKAKAELEMKLRRELAAGDMSVSMKNRGLVVTLLDRILFDSGKAELKPSAQIVLDKLAGTLASKAEENMIYVEGHTDNQPILYSGWRSNWELSTARATEVIHYFIEARGLNPRQFAATGYGEYHPVSSNESAQGRVANRRVEIVISPRKFDDLS